MKPGKVGRSKSKSMKELSTIGTKEARARLSGKILVRDMIYDMSEAYKISMVSMSKRLTNSRN